MLFQVRRFWLNVNDEGWIWQVECLVGFWLDWVFGWGTVELTLSNLTVLIRQC